MKRPFQGAAAEMLPKTHDNILQRNTERLSADKISVIERLAYKNKAFIIVLLETNYGQASDSQLFTSWVSPEQEPRPCHVCP